MIKGADLQVNVSKAEVICLRGNRNNLARNRTINLVEKNLIELEMFPTRTKKTEALTCGAQFPEHRH